MSTGTKISQYVAEDIKKNQGVLFPVHANFMQRHLIHRVPVTSLHPNPEDEFCDPNIGPNPEIIDKYVQAFKESGYNGDLDCGVEPLIVERVHPDGYLILNGHHRWAAAMQLGLKEIPVKIVNLPHENDIRQMLKRSRNHQRVTFDLDEVVFCNDVNQPAEAPLGFPLNCLYKEKLRRGIPKLFNQLNQMGYDIWVYSNHCYSYEHIAHYLMFYNARVTGVVTGGGKLFKAMHQNITSALSEHYAQTIHIDNSTVTLSHSNDKQFEDYSLPGVKEWALEVIDIIKEIDRHET